MEAKYFKPKSLTWWASVVPIGAGLFIAAQPYHQMAEVVQFIDTVTGGLEPAVMINAGLAGIGLRGAL